MPTTNTLEQNKQIASSYIERFWNGGDHEHLDTIMSAEVTTHKKTAGGRDAFKTFADTLRKSMPDLHYAIQSVIAEGDQVVLLLSSSGTYSGTEINAVPPTNQKGAIDGVVVLTVKDGKIVHARQHWDFNPFAFSSSAK